MLVKKAIALSSHDRVSYVRFKWAGTGNGAILDSPDKEAKSLEGVVRNEKGGLCGLGQTGSKDLVTSHFHCCKQYASSGMGVCITIDVYDWHIKFALLTRILGGINIDFFGIFCNISVLLCATLYIRSVYIHIIPFIWRLLG